MTGILNFLNKAIVPGHAFTQGMYAKLKLTDKNGNPHKRHHHVWLNAQFIQDCCVWWAFLSNVRATELCRPFLDVNAFQYVHVLNFYTDASLNLLTGGLGGVYNNNWIAETWGTEFLLRCKPSIEFLELFALTAGIITWSNSLVNPRSIVFCDNEAVKNMVNSLASSCEQCRKLIRILALDGIQKNRRVFIRYISSKFNILADALSRGKMRLFWRVAPKTMNKIKNKIPDCVWPVEKLWHKKFI